jgi:hypothetical protein
LFPLREAGPQTPLAWISRDGGVMIVVMATAGRGTRSIRDLEGDERMKPGVFGQLGMALAWLVFPMLPVILEDFYYQVCVNLFGSSRAGPDPHSWGWSTWLLMLGPLLGYGFLAGSTAEVSDDVCGPLRGWRRIVARRAVWVALGPWAGFLLFIGVVMGLDYFRLSLHSDPFATWRETWVFAVLSWACTVIVVGIFAYGWLWPAWAALRRAGRIGLWRRALYRGLITALAFAGSLFGSFWAITSAWRSFFFDKRLMPMVAMAMSLVVVSGCAGPVTYGELRRRELFHAMLLAWVFGLALIWWWSSRRRRRPPRPGDGEPSERRSS